jgi:hypothetical protein
VLEPSIPPNGQHLLYESKTDLKKLVSFDKEPRPARLLISEHSILRKRETPSCMEGIDGVSLVTTQIIESVATQIPKPNHALE